MEWLFSADVALFRFINETLSHPALDWLLPYFSWNVFFLPATVVLGAGLIWRGGPRGAVFVLLLGLALAIGDGVVCDALKDGFDRPRPFAVLEDVRVLVGKGGSGSMPSAHAANWAAALVVTAVFYRRAAIFVALISLIVWFSRVYLGVHYPSDVFVGALVGAAAAGGVLLSMEFLWRRFGRRVFPELWLTVPSLRAAPDTPVRFAWSQLNEQQWRRLGYGLILVTLLGRLAYLASGEIQLSEDEAYQWLWSKHLDLSYYSKPPLIAYVQFLGTRLWGDTEFGIRFFSPISAALLSVLAFRLVAAQVSARAAFGLIVMLTATPVLAVGATLMTIDALSVLFWGAAMVTGWRAVQENSTRAWLWTGLWMGAGFLSKYVALLQVLSWAVFFVLWKPARAQLRRRGPYLALALLALSFAPVLIWNAQHDWITLTHLGERGGLSRAWRPTLRFFGDFVGAELGLLNPVFAFGVVTAAIGIWRRPRTPFEVYLFSMGAPLFLFYFFYTFRSRVQPNWIAPSIVPLFCLAAVYWRSAVVETRWVRRTFAIALWIGFIAVVVLHDTHLVRKVTGWPLPVKVDPLRRVRGWSEAAEVVEAERQRVLSEGRPVFVIGAHYGITSLLSFYLPGARQQVQTDPLVYYCSAEQPQNQFYFWPGYGHRRGEDALYVVRTEQAQEAPARLRDEFTEVRDLGLRDVRHRDQVFHRIQIFECRGLR